MIYSQVFEAPGSQHYAQRGRQAQDAFIRMMVDIRDNHINDYPILPGAISVYESIVVGREVKISAPRISTAQRAVDWLHDSISPAYTGLIDYGFEPFLRRRVMDYLVIGRTLLLKRPDQPLRYLDPGYVRFVFDERGGYWQDRYTKEQFSIDEVLVDHPKPRGSSGSFSSFVYPLLPSAMLAWLIREHDLASADGRKIRDILLVGSEELYKSMAQAIEDSIKAWSGADPTMNGVPMVWTETGSLDVDMSKIVAKFSLASVPPGFNRSDFYFDFANEVAANLGLALRQFYNSEKATNRALEEVQEARQMHKGPNLFTRTEERLINRPGMIDRFGRRVRFGFVEDSDIYSQNARGQVLESYSKALKIFSEVFNSTINGAAFLAWLQSEDILPNDLELFFEPGSVVYSDRPETLLEKENLYPQANKIESSQRTETGNASTLDYDEVSIDLNGKLIEKRRRVISTASLIDRELDAHLNALSQANTDRGLKIALDKIFETHYNAIRSYPQAFYQWLVDQGLEPFELTDFSQMTDAQKEIVSRYVLR